MRCSAGDALLKDTVNAAYQAALAGSYSANKRNVDL